MLANLADLVDECTAAFDAYDYARSLDRAESSFWGWCDNYLELVKARAYREGSAAASAHAALQLGLSVYLRLLAPFLPFVTEEVWSWWREGSIHRAPWPEAGELEGLTGDSAVLETVTGILGEVRKAKSDARVSMRTAVERLDVRDTAERLERVRAGLADLRDAARADSVELTEASPPAVEVALRE